MMDIEAKEDLIVLVNTFYDQVKKDEVIGYIFNTIIGDDWSVHLPIMYSFWNTVLFGEEGYKGQAIAKHIEIDKRIPIRAEHYERWIALWRQTTDKLYTGPNATRIKEKALTMLQLIQYKVDASHSGKSLY